MTTETVEVNAQEANHHSVGFYVKIYFALLFLTGASVITSFAFRETLAATLIISIILTFSTIKALMIAMYYMHLADEKIPIRIWAYMAVAIFVILFFLILPDGTANLKQ